MCPTPMADDDYAPKPQEEIDVDELLKHAKSPDVLERLSREPDPVIKMSDEDDPPTGGKKGWRRIIRRTGGGDDHAGGGSKRA